MTKDLAIAEANEILGRLSFTQSQGVHAMGKHVAVSILVRPAAEANETQIEVVCLTFGHLEVDWSEHWVVLKDENQQEFSLRLDRRGHAAKTMKRSAVDTPMSTVGLGKKVAAMARFVATKRPDPPASKELQAAAATPHPATMFTDFVVEFWSPDMKVHCKLIGSRGGDLDVIFTATDLKLKGASVSFRFSTTAGRTLEGEKQLWPDAGNPKRLFASWKGNQLSLAQPQGPAGENAAQEIELMLEFNVVLPDGK